MGPSSRRSRSRSDSRERGSSKSKKSEKKKSSSSAKGGGGGGLGGGSRSHSRERTSGGKGESRRGEGREGGHHDTGRERDRSRERERDRDRDRHHREKNGRKGDGGGRSRSGRDDGGRDGSRDRKRPRGSGSGRRGGGDHGEGGGNPDDMWKRKLRDEDEQMKELDLDSLMVDEEEEERRLEEQRRKRKDKLEALQKRKNAEEAAAAAAAAASRTTANNGDLGDAKNGGGYPNDSDSDSDQDAGPIEITKQASRHGEGGIGEADDDDEPAARNGGEGNAKGNANVDMITTNNDNTDNPTATGVSSTELRAQQGKEDRPVFDMFSAAALPAAGGPGGKVGGKGGGGGAHGMSFLGEDGGGDQGNWTDVEGYYKTRVGEVIGGRYTVLGTVGQGVFSTVLKCLDTRGGPAALGGGSEVALKMIRNNDTMRKAAQKEVALLRELAEHDPSNKKHCIRLLSSLEHKQHVVMVFESMQMNLRETLKKFGRKTGINIHAVQKYGKQLLAALKHMASRNLVHADIKPDNILVDQGFGSLKLADFGSAFRESDPDNDPTPYLVSRWYRAPEIVMGLDYDRAIDLWSVAVTLFELYKGSPVLPGVNNNEMLKRMMEFKGPVPTRMIKSHMRAFETMGGIRPHFTEGGQFMQQEPDPVSGQTTVRLVTVTAPSRPIKSDIMRSKGAQDKKETVADLADFLDKCMSLDPKQRITLAQCSAHSFLRRV